MFSRLADNNDIESPVCKEDGKPWRSVIIGGTPEKSSGAILLAVHAGAGVGKTAVLSRDAGRWLRKLKGFLYVITNPGTR